VLPNEIKKSVATCQSPAGNSPAGSKPAKSPINLQSDRNWRARWTKSRRDTQAGRRAEGLAHGVVRVRTMVSSIASEVMRGSGKRILERRKRLPRRRTNLSCLDSNRSGAHGIWVCRRPFRTLRARAADQPAATAAAVVRALAVVRGSADHAWRDRQSVVLLASLTPGERVASRRGGLPPPIVLDHRRFPAPRRDWIGDGHLSRFHTLAKPCQSRRTSGESHDIEP
jgi:hypothetical protein